MAPSVAPRGMERLGCSVWSWGARAHRVSMKISWRPLKSGRDRRMDEDIEGARVGDDDGGGERESDETLRMFS
jgi:hypothetical protein